MGKARQERRAAQHKARQDEKRKAKQDMKEQALMLNGLHAIYCEEFPVERIWCQRAVRLMEGKYRGC